MAVTSESLAGRFGISAQLVDLVRQTRGTTNTSLEEIPERKLRRAIRRLSYPDSARQRHEHLLKTARGDDGSIPRNAVAHALRQVDAKLRTRRNGHVAGVSRFYQPGLDPSEAPAGTRPWLRTGARV